VRAARLRRNADIDAVRRHGALHRDRLFALRARPNATGQIRIAVSAPGSLGRAVARNRTRRRTREAFRLVIKDMGAAAGHDLLVVALPPAAAASGAALRRAAAGALAWLAKS